MRGDFTIEVADQVAMVRVTGNRDRVDGSLPSAGSGTCRQGIPAVPYTALAMQARSIDVPWAQRALDERARPELRRAVVVPDAKLAFLARLAFGDNDRVFYDDISAAMTWLRA
jgi:hypothetical protein